MHLLFTELTNFIARKSMRESDMTPTEVSAVHSPDPLLFTFGSDSRPRRLQLFGGKRMSVLWDCLLSSPFVARVAALIVS